MKPKSDFHQHFIYLAVKLIPQYSLLLKIADQKEKQYVFFKDKL